MELLELDPLQLGVTDTGVYVVDDEGAVILAGPFAHETDAIAWIVQIQADRCAKTVPTVTAMSEEAA